MFPHNSHGKISALGHDVRALNKTFTSVSATSRDGLDSATNLLSLSILSSSSPESGYFELVKPHPNNV